MRFNDHFRLKDKHSFMSPSSYSWVNYDEQKMDARIYASFAARRGSDLHDLAQRAIKLGVKLPDTQETINAYVNDCIGFRMTPEQTLFYSDNCFGTADAISYRNGKLRIFDLKTGITKTSMMQLFIYAALFCLEYGLRAVDLEFELRIYQSDDVWLEDDQQDIILKVTRIMSQIVVFDKRIKELEMEVYG
jgi:hypothetical protein